MICGSLKPDHGSMTFDGKTFHPKSIIDARSKGIAILLQERGTIDGMSVAENMFIGMEDDFKGHFGVNKDKMQKKAKEILEGAGCVMGEDGFYTRAGEKVGFIISVGAGDQVRIDMAQAAASQLQAVGIDCSVEIPAQVDWGRGRWRILSAGEALLTRTTTPIRFSGQAKAQIIPGIPTRKWTGI